MPFSFSMALTEGGKAVGVLAPGVSAAEASLPDITPVAPATPAALVANILFKNLRRAGLIGFCSSCMLNPLKIKKSLESESPILQPKGIRDEP